MIMNEERKQLPSVMLYVEEMQCFLEADYLSSEEKVLILSALIEYCRTGRPAVFKDRAMQIVFNDFKRSADRDRARYVKRVESAKKAARARHADSYSSEINHPVNTAYSYANLSDISQTASLGW